jgi:hypothetical protein
LGHRAQPDVDQLDRIAVRSVSVGALVLGAETVVECTQGRRVEAIGPKWQPKLERLPSVAEIQRALEPIAGRVIVFAAELGANGAIQRLEGRFELVRVQVTSDAQNRPTDVMGQVGTEQAKRTEQARPARDDHPPDAELAGDQRGVDRPVSTVGDQREASRVSATLGRHGLYHPNHVRDREPMDTEGGL